MIKATATRICGQWEIVALANGRIINGEQYYEMRYSYRFGGKVYKDEAAAIKAILRNGYEYVEIDDRHLVAGYND